MIVRVCMFCMRFARAYSVTLSTQKKQQKPILDLKVQVLICCVGIWAQYIQFAHTASSNSYYRMIDQIQGLSIQYCPIDVMGIAVENCATIQLEWNKLSIHFILFEN